MPRRAAACHAIAHQLRQRLILRGLQAGDPVPSLREIMRTFDVSLSVARDAMGELVRAGEVRSIPRQCAVLAAIKARSESQRPRLLVLLVGLKATDSFSVAFLRLLDADAEAEGVTIEVGRCGSRVDSAAALVDHHRPAAVLLIGQFTAKMIAAIRRPGLTVLLIGASPDRTTEVASCHYDDRGAILLGTQHLLALGHRRIGLLHMVSATPSIAVRAEVWRATLQAAGVAVDERLREAVGVDEHAGDEASQALSAAERLLASDATAVVVANDWLLSAWSQAWARKPRHCSVVSFGDGGSYPDADRPRVTTMVDRRLLPQAVLRLLREAIRGRPPRELVVPAVLRLRGSTWSVATGEAMDNPEA